jgi:adenylate cyclase
MPLQDYHLAAPGPGSGRRRLERRLAAILGADIMGNSALMERNEEETHRRVGAELDRFRREIEKSHGRVFSFTGDGLMAEFPSAVEALKCALRVQAEAGKRNARLPIDHQIIFGIGLNSGELILQKGRTGGTAVNIAARLEQIAEPGGVCLSSSVFEQVRRIVTTRYEFLGDQRLKNIRDPVAVYGVRAASCSTWPGMPALPRLTGSTIPDTGPAEAAVEYRPSLAVLPFRTLQRDQSDAYFAEGMVDDIISGWGD